MAESTELNARQDKAIAALISEPTITAAAAKSGVSERVLYRWIADSKFGFAYREARRAAVSQSIAALQRSTSDAVQILLEVMNNREEQGKVRMAAAKSVIEFAVKGVEIDDLASRIEMLEAQLGKMA